jgi:hypothetical protein
MAITVVFYYINCRESYTYAGIGTPKPLRLLNKEALHIYLRGTPVNELFFERNYQNFPLNGYFLQNTKSSKSE